MNNDKTSPVAPEQVVAAGWKLVPVKPTPEMIAAMSVVECTATCINRFTDNTEEEVPILGMAGSEEAYAAMLAASPEAAPAAMEGTTVAWGRCPVCGEDDMRYARAAKGEPALIHCTNHACRSNGGDYDATAATPAAPSAGVVEAIRSLQAMWDTLARCQQRKAVAVTAHDMRTYSSALSTIEAALAQPAPVQAGAQQAVVEEATLAQLMQVAQIDCVEVRADGKPLTRAERFASRFSGNREEMVAEWRITFNALYGLHDSEDDLGEAILHAYRAHARCAALAAPTQAGAGAAKGGA